MIIGLLTMLPLTIMPNVNAQPTAAEQLKAQIEPQPTANGCYHWTKETGWKTITCISPEELKKQPADIPTEGGNVYPGVVGGHSSSNPYWGEVETKFSQYSGETDTYY
ncbi:MAG: hypothetical protein KGL95_01835, partial [Patescibacteria group bacterium]|nr:hypothetical protein [Patescibacteria group bacterium]